jgi:phage shock protein A
MLQEQAESAVGAGDWIENTIEDLIAEATAEKLSMRYRRNHR